jgi:anoctamin-10
LLAILSIVHTNDTRQFIQESLGGEEAENAAAGSIAQGEKISRSTSGDEARESTLHGDGTPEERFWARQRGQAETIAIGRQYISKAAPNETKKDK